MPSCVHPRDLTDAALARALAALGEVAESSATSRSALEAELFRRYAPRVRLYGLRHLHGESAAADLVQDVLALTLVKLRRGEVREPEKLTSFVLGTARMMSRDEQRRAPLCSPEEMERAALVPGPPPDTWQLDRERLRACVSGLPERERSIVLLTFFEQQSAQEIGRALQMQPGNVRVARTRALTRLRDCMGLAGGES